jgi:hypothetical protein
MYDPIGLAAFFWSDLFWWVAAPFIVLVLASVLVGPGSGKDGH